LKSIILFGTWGEDNTGDDILLLSQIEGIRARCPGCGIAIFSGVPVHTKKLLDRELTSYDHIEIVYTGRLGIREPGKSFPHSLGWFVRNLREISRGRLLVIGPGNQLQDVTMRFRVVFFLSRAVAAWILRTPYAFVGIGYYQLTSRFCRRLFRFTGNRAAFISTRDQGGAEKIRKIGVLKTEVVPLADFSFSQERKVQQRQHSGSDSPVIGLTTWIFLPQVFPPSVANNFESCLADLVRWIINNNPGARFRFFPFYKGSCWNDCVALERIRDRFQGTDVPVETVEFRSLDELRRSISLCDAFIGVRYHSVLLSVQGEVPVMGISYAHKTQRFMQENGLGDYVVRVEDVTSARLQEIWERLWRNRDEVREMLPRINEHETALARKHFDLILKTPGKEYADSSFV
jgi:polysaccharide pyruvyl transferase WcaK-like protein